MFGCIRARLFIARRQTENIITDLKTDNIEKNSNHRKEI